MKPSRELPAADRVSAAIRALNPHVYPSTMPVKVPLAPKTDDLPVSAAPKKKTATEKKRKNEANTDRKLPHTEPQRVQAPALDAANAREAEGIPRTRIRFTGYRVRPLDPDNFAGSVKDLLDGLRHAGLIPGDEPWRIALETEQVKVASFTKEKTVIEIDNRSA